MNDAFYAQELSDEQLEMVVGGRNRLTLQTLTNVQLNVAVAPQVNVVLFSSLTGSSLGGVTTSQGNGVGQDVQSH